MRTAWIRLTLWVLVCALLCVVPYACAAPLGGMIRLLEETGETPAPEEAPSVSPLCVQVHWDDLKIAYKWDADAGKWKAQEESVDAAFKFTNLTEDRGVAVTLSQGGPLPETIRSVSDCAGVIIGAGSKNTITMQCAVEQWLDKDADFGADTIPFTISLEEVQPESEESAP